MLKAALELISMVADFKRDHKSRKAIKENLKSLENAKSKSSQVAYATGAITAASVTLLNGSMEEQAIIELVVQILVSVVGGGLTLLFYAKKDPHL